jgi:hypothetical protein
MATLTRDLTYSALVAEIAAGTLNEGESILITDRGDQGIMVTACSNNKLHPTGTRFMLCPATYAITAGEDDNGNDWIGVWNAVKGATATEGQLTIWNGLVWVAGATLSGDAPAIDGSGWTVIPKASFTNHEYIEMIFGVEYDVANDWINKQWDAKGNVFGLSKEFYLWWYEPEGAYDNFIDYCDWNFATSGNPFENNTCFYCYNNSNAGGIYSNSNAGGIYNNSNAGGIYNNNSNAGSIYSNSNAGIIYSNSNAGGIYNNNSNTGDIYNNSNAGIIYNNSNAGQISSNSNAGGIYSNSNTGSINTNSNAGEIYSNSSITQTTCNITMNQNNGEITGVWDADVTDVTVSKIGSAT